MKEKSESIIYKPGQYGKKRMTASQWTESYIRRWTNQQRESTPENEFSPEPPVICFSRKIGVGALEIADIVAQKINFKVIDREILEHMAAEANLTKQTVEFFDERYPGKMSEFMNMLIKEKSFIKSDYARQLVKSVIALANLEQTLFVGRGTHLILPRERVLAVRFICSHEFRINRLAGELGIDKERAEERLREIDKEQHGFFKSVYRKKDASPYEFDLIINRDYISDAHAAADIVACAYEHKFGRSV